MFYVFRKHFFKKLVKSNSKPFEMSRISHTRLTGTSSANGENLRDILA